MKAAPLILFLTAGGLMLWFYPDILALEPPEPAAELRVAADPGGAEASGSWAVGEAALRRAADGHFYAEVLVDSVPTRMMVDTGASVIALTGADAEALGLSWSEDDLRPIARGAGGMVHGFALTLDHVRLGEIELRGVPAVVVPEGLAVSLLGQSFLGRTGRMEVSGEHMLIGG